MEDLKTFLQSIAPLSDAEWEASRATFQSRVLQKGDFFVQHGQLCRQIAFIQYGTLRNYYLNERAEEVTACFCTERQFATSYKSFITQEASTLALEAIEETAIFTLEYEELQKMYARSAAWQTIGRTLAEREYIVMERYASVLNNESAKEKYLRLMREQPSVIQKAKVEHIASYLGVTRRTLSRIRKEISA